MQWFWDHYADPADRADPRVVAAARRRPLGPAAGVRGHVRVRPAPRRRHRLRQGAGGGRRAGAPCSSARGHTHTSLTMVDVILSGAPVRAEMAEALRQFFGASVPA